MHAWIFFYGTFMSADVLRAQGIEADTTVPAKLSGYRLTVRPRVNLESDRSDAAYGGIAFIEHGAIASLYDGLDRDFGVSYLPQAVLTELPDGSLRPALCYLAPRMKEADADPAYVEELEDCARAMHAPTSYLRHIRSFRAPSES